MQARPITAYVHGPNSDVVIVPARVCAWLEVNTSMEATLAGARGRDGEVADVLSAMRLAAAAWFSSARGTPVAAPAEPEPDSEWLNTHQAAGRLKISDRAIRKAAESGGLTGKKIDGRWKISRESIALYGAIKGHRKV